MAVNKSLTNEEHVLTPGESQCTVPHKETVMRKAILFQAIEILNDLRSGYILQAKEQERFETLRIRIIKRITNS